MSGRAAAGAGQRTRVAHAPRPPAAPSDAQLRAIYCAEVDARADRESAAWWAQVLAELRLVLAARSPREAAAAIAWWHADWSAVGDTALAVAQRLRAAARALCQGEPGAGRAPCRR